ncbi:sulfatase-like hydrolase/transferase [Neobacillus niacini]|uniref:sulfatase-like hydrolase/transferase n=1 Tax=Neobacillus niacini TaxID=86668 RepID=UPI0021CB163F|nr:sulfatase-like hydrolase/transferase [Neobacillus niacini]MCM3763692.1 sulfatase-like hydrolase/transferase [Neobacillus niacini]
MNRHGNHHNCSEENERRARPNILVILVDQLRFPQGSFNQELLDRAAPNLAKLRLESVSFDAHYAAATACSPSRSALLTGLYTHQNGMFLTNTDGFVSDMPPTPDLNPDFPTWGSVLQCDYGYRTFWWGKWHLSNTCPLDRYGFQRDALPCPSPNGGPGEGLEKDPEIADLFIHWLKGYDHANPWCTTVSLVNPHDVQWFPEWTKDVPGEKCPPPIKEFHEALPANFERWPEALFLQNKPTAQAAWALICDKVFGEMPYHGHDFEELWFQLLDLYYLATQYVDRQIKRVLRALKKSKYADNTIVVFTSDHGEYGGANGLRGKAFAVYESSTHIPLYVKDPTGMFMPPDQAGTTRDGLTSHVDILPLLLTFASGNNKWRDQPQYAQWSGRADLASMLGSRCAKGRNYILHTSDEDIPEEGPKLGIPYCDTLISQVQLPEPLPRRPIPTHVIGYRTKYAKLGVYSRWTPGTIQITTDGQEYELYDYAKYGTDEVTNNAPGGPMPEPELFADLYQQLKDAVATELRRPLPRFLQPVQRQAIADYLAFEDRVKGC